MLNLVLYYVIERFLYIQIDMVSNPHLLKIHMYSDRCRTRWYNTISKFKYLFKTDKVKCDLLKSFLTYCSRLHTFVAYLKRKVEEHFNTFHCNYWNQLKQVSVTKIEFFCVFHAFSAKRFLVIFFFPLSFVWAIQNRFSGSQLTELNFKEIIFLSFKITVLVCIV